jgi:hypothetical protein
MLVDIASSHIHIIFIPPSHFSILMVQRGIIVMFIFWVAVMLVGIPGIIVAIEGRSIVIISVVGFIFWLLVRDAMPLMLARSEAIKLNFTRREFI